MAKRKGVQKGQPRRGKRRSPKTARGQVQRSNPQRQRRSVTVVGTSKGNGRTKVRTSTKGKPRKRQGRSRTTNFRIPRNLKKVGIGIVLLILLMLLIQQLPSGQLSDGRSAAAYAVSGAIETIWKILIGVVASCAIGLVLLVALALYVKFGRDRSTRSTSTTSNNGKSPENGPNEEMYNWLYGMHDKPTAEILAKNTHGNTLVIGGPGWDHREWNDRYKSKVEWFVLEGSLLTGWVAKLNVPAEELPGKYLQRCLQSYNGPIERTDKGDLYPKKTGKFNRYATAKFVKWLNKRLNFAVDWNGAMPEDLQGAQI